MPLRRNKYGNRRVETPDGVFDSAGEYQRWQQLKLLERGGQIAELERQVRFDLCVNFRKPTKICTYVADFRYWDNKTGQRVVEDFKGVQTAVFRLKAKLFEAIHGIPITVTGRIRSRRAARKA